MSMPREGGPGPRRDCLWAKPSRANALMRCRRALLGLAFFGMSLSSCRERQAGELRVVLGPGTEMQPAFTVETALAEFVGLGPEGSELRLSLASYSGLDCQGFSPPAPGEYLVSVTVWVPAGQTIRAGEYPWSGAGQQSGEVTGATGPSRAVPIVRSSRGNHEIFPGGHLELTEVELAPYGAVAGLLAFEYPGNASAPATAIMGRFKARLCRFAPAQPDPA